MLDSDSVRCAYKELYISLPTQPGAIQLLMKTADPSALRTQESEASKEQSDCSCLVQPYDAQERRAFTILAKLLNFTYVFTNLSASRIS
jgi:hypothetical protein